MIRTIRILLNSEKLRFKSVNKSKFVTWLCSERTVQVRPSLLPCSCHDLTDNRPVKTGTETGAWVGTETGTETRIKTGIRTWILIEFETGTETWINIGTGIQKYNIYHTTLENGPCSNHLPCKINNHFGLVLADNFLMADLPYPLACRSV